MIPSQMLKGTLEGCVLAVLRADECYRYEISQRLLLLLEKRGAITASYRASAEGPQRKYYTLTAQGQAELEEFLCHYREMTRAVDQLIQETGGRTHEK